MRIGTGVFREAIKAVEANRLGEEYAVEAVNCDLRTGAIVPMAGQSADKTAPAGAERIYLWQGKIACFTQRDVSVMQHPNNDNLVWAGSDYGAYPRQASLAQFFPSGDIGFSDDSDRFGVDTPPDAPLVRVNGTAGTDLLRSTSYRFSAVAPTGEESGLSLPSSVIDVYEGQEAEIYQFWADAAPTTVSNIRVYRGETDQYGTPSWVFVAELAANTASWVDDVEETEEVAETDGHLPPEDFLGIFDLGNGITIGWKGRDVHLSDVGFPAAFPVKYMLRTNSDVVGVGVTGGFGIVLTTGSPYLLSAQTPESATFAELQYAAPCLSMRSICSTELGVIFASTDGLMQISSGGVLSNLTEGILSREQWQELDPGNTICVVHDGKVYGFAYGSESGWMLDMKKQGIVEISLPVAISDAHVDDEGDRLVLLDANESVGDFGAGSALEFRWKSAEWLFSRATAFSVARVIGDQDGAHPASLKVWKDGQLFYTKDGITNSRPFIIPRGLYLSAQYEISGTAKVRVVHLASDVEELG